eukprot:TRINITY_DN1617_c0_g1_i5.p1 TRINITY_DN1617_c0_g1~~TRINITY_DN1617_c0_g1_i5.p1  ORF type:complete len:306 (-),score=95.15 TRINITY_DN1617_c0_g1_i5:777-1694(-)
MAAPQDASKNMDSVLDACEAQRFVDLDRVAAARGAFASGDKEASREIAHSADAIEKTITEAKEKHASGETGELVKSLVFGGLDGIITTFAIVAASAGASLSTKHVILLGCSNLIADGISMGMGDFISERAEQRYVANEYAREQWEMDNYMEGEVAEMTALWKGKGMSSEDATLMINTLAKYPKIFLDQMFVDELGLMPPSDDPADEFRSTCRKGLCMFLSFVIFGSVPLLTYIIARLFGHDVEDGTLFVLAAVSAALTMFTLGFVKGRLTKQPAIMSGVSVLLNGVAAAIAAYLIGWSLEELIVN